MKDPLKQSRNALEQALREIYKPVLSSDNKQANNRHNASREQQSQQQQQ